MEKLKVLFGTAMYHTKLSRLALIDEIGRRNGVRRGTVYSWLGTDDPVSQGRLRATLDDMIEESKAEKISKPK